MSLNGTKLTFSLAGLMLICLKKVQQAIDAGKLIKEVGIGLDRAYTSVLKRAIKTTKPCAWSFDHQGPSCKSWRLNERHYGGLTGKNKAEALNTWWWTSSHLAFITMYCLLQWTDDEHLSNALLSLCFTWSIFSIPCWKLESDFWNAPFHLEDKIAPVKDGKTYS